MSWTPLKDVERRSQEIALVDKVLNAQLAITDSVSAGLSQGMTGSKKVEEVHDHKS